MDINNGFDRHLDPPDDEEAVICEYCNQEMELCTKGYTHFTCENQFCPSKFDIKCGTTVIDMANHLAEVEQKLKSTQDSLKYVRSSLSSVQSIRERHERTIEKLEQKIAELTQSQQGEE